MHWGDPDSLSRFIDHVTGKSHRQGYVFTKSGWEYVLRTKDVIWNLGSQFGIGIVLAVWGWLKLSPVRWRVFFLFVVVFDLFYSVFLNIISLEITPFGIPSAIAVAILMGLGAGRILRAIAIRPGVGQITRRASTFVFCLIPAIPLSVNYGLCNQSRNYAGYEHLTNIFRTVGPEATIILDGDNNIFPVAYGRIVERIGEDVTLYDRPNVFFKMPYFEEREEQTAANGHDPRPALEKRIIDEAANGVYYCVFNPFAITVPEGYAMYPYGILQKIAKVSAPKDTGDSVWSRYVTLSLDDDFIKDFMNRQVAANFLFAKGKYLFTSGSPEQGLASVRRASRVGYDDTTIHSDMAVFLTDQGAFEEARRELDMAMAYHQDLSGIYNNRGYYHNRTGEYAEAAKWYRKAIELRPDSYGYYNNLGLALRHAGDEGNAVLAFERSLAINPDQPELRTFMSHTK